jgi:hypothetical protein
MGGFERFYLLGHAGIYSPARAGRVNRRFRPSGLHAADRSLTRKKRPARLARYPAPPTTGGTVTFAATQRLAIINPPGTLAAWTVQLPACASTNDGDERSFLTTQALTALTISAAAGSIGNGAATTAAAGSGHAYHFLVSATTWYQMY